jgi:hypothetical protein
MSNVTNKIFHDVFIYYSHFLFFYYLFLVLLDLMDPEWPHLSMLSPPTGTLWAIQHHQLRLVARDSLTLTLFS